MKKSSKKRSKQSQASEIARMTPPAEPITMPQPNWDLWYRRLFWGSLPIMFFCLLVAGYDTGVCYDELTQNVYAKANIEFYKSGGVDTTCFAPQFTESEGKGKLHGAIKYYTTVFDYVGIAVNKVLGKIDGYEFNTRHILVQFISILGLFFTGRFAQLLTNSYRAAVIAIWLLFLTPLYFGMSLFNPKDIPFLTGYIASLFYFIRFLQQMPRPTWKISLSLMVALFCTLGVRIGGVMLFGYFLCVGLLYYLLHRNELPELFKNAKNWLPKIAVVAFGAVTLVVLSWPYVLVDPLVRLKEAIFVAEKFPQKIPVLYDGVLTNSLELPAGYLYTMMSITIPAFVLVMFLVSSVILLLNRKRYNGTILILLLISSLFPLFYAEWKHASMYNGWRHFLFTYPGIIICTATGLNWIAEHLKKYQALIFVLIIVAMINPIQWILRTTPYQYTYFNEFVGGLPKVFHDYEKDYWFISVKEAIDWLVENEIERDNRDTVTIATNSVAFTHYYFKRRYPNLKVKVEEVGMKGRNTIFWDYAIMGNFYIPPVLEELHYPPPLTIHTIDIAGMPVNAIIKDRERYDKKAVQALLNHDIPLADSLFDLHLKHIGYSGGDMDFGGIAGEIAFAKLALNQLGEAERFAQHALVFNADDYLGNLVTGVIHYHFKRKKEAIFHLMKAKKINPADVYANHYLKQLGIE